MRHRQKNRQRNTVAKPSFSLLLLLPRTNLFLAEMTRDNADSVVRIVVVVVVAAAAGQSKSNLLHGRHEPPR